MSRMDIRKIDLDRADMHLHTTFSDGLLTPAEIVKRARDMGCDTIAITDHDLVEGVGEAQAAAAVLGGIKVIPGIELSTEGPDSTELHILGYYIDVNNPDLLKTLAVLKNRRKDRNTRLFAGLQAMGVDVSQADFDISEGNDYIGKPMIAKKMAEKGYITHSLEAFEEGKFLESPAIRAVKKEKITAEEAILLINKSGGTSVLAHPMKIRRIGDRGSDEFWRNLTKLIGILSEWGIEGLECYYPDHTNRESAKLVELAKKFGLEITKGSDYHGYTY